MHVSARGRLSSPARGQNGRQKRTKKPQCTLTGRKTLSSLQDHRVQDFDGVELTSNDNLDFRASGHLRARMRTGKVQKSLFEKPCRRRLAIRASNAAVHIITGGYQEPCFNLVVTRIHLGCFDLINIYLCPCSLDSSEIAFVPRGRKAVPCIS